MMCHKLPKVSISQFITTTERNLHCRLCIQEDSSKLQILTIVPNEVFTHQMNTWLRKVGMGPLAGIIEDHETVLNFIYSRLQIRDLSKIENFCTLLDQPILLKALVENVNEAALRSFFLKGIKLNNGMNF